MYKRVTKREKKKRDEEKRGITTEMKLMIGMGDTDSDESLESTESEGEKEQPELYIGKRKRTGEDDTDENSDDVGSILSNETKLQEEAAESMGSADGQDTEDIPLFNISVEEALAAPIQDGSCVICPGKVFKTLLTETTHRESAHHKRRLKRFQALAERLVSKSPGIYSNPAAILVRQMEEEQQERAKQSRQFPGGQSNRAKKKEAYAKKKEKRKLRWLRKKATAAASGEKPEQVTDQPRKKRKKGENS
ncbi:hypothetical protein FRC17_010176 [Serendipita sp. 399]|nr:hypothetical protein FRC17_010176 [Serendipita sp. 399]